MLYRRVNVPLSNLKYRWEHTMFDSDMRPKTIKLATFARYEKDLSKAEKDIRMVAASLLSDGLQTPLTIKQAWYEKPFDFEKDISYVVVGNQRLCALKGMTDIQIEMALGNNAKRIPCLVEEEQDTWGDDNQVSKYLKEENHPLVGINIDELCIQEKSEQSKIDGIWPLFVYTDGEGRFRVGKYQERLRALKELGFKGLVPCRVFPKDNI